MNDEVRQIKERLSCRHIAETCGMSFKKAGGLYKACCPYPDHQEKTPSFVIWPADDSFYCFGCQRGGDIFKLAQDLRGLSFGEALHEFAAMAGIELPERAGYSKEGKEKRARLQELLLTSLEFFQECLSRKVGEAARHYLFTKAGRELPATVAVDFALGFAPDVPNGLVRYLTNRNFTGQEMLAAGVARDYNGKLYDFFRNRIVFPIRNRRGELCGFTARTLANEEPKYLNSPQTLLFDKGSLLYGLDRAADSIRKTGKVVIVEGTLDAIRSYKAGVLNTVAPLGTALTTRHIEELRRIRSDIELVLAYDSDQAGGKATDKAIELVRLGQSSRIKVKVVEVEGKDPDEMARNNPAGWREAVEGALPVVDYLFHRVDRELDLTTVEGKQEAVKRLAVPIYEVKEILARAHYISLLASMTGVQKAVIEEMLTNRQETTTSVKPKVMLPSLPANGGVIKLDQNKLELNVLRNLVAFYHQDAARIVSSDGAPVGERDFDNPIHLVIFKAIQFSLTGWEGPDSIVPMLEEEPEALKIWQQLEEAADELEELSDREVERACRYDLDRLRKGQFRRVYDMMRQSVGDSSEDAISAQELIESADNILQLMKAYD